MLNVLDKLRERKRFMETTLKAREREKAEGTNKNVPPIFNKRLFCAGSISITRNTQNVMKRNEEHLTEHSFHLTESEYLPLTNIVSGLKYLHHGKDYIKRVICNCITYEHYDAFQYIQKKPHENCISCYYVLTGALEATYVVDDDNVHNIFQPNIIYFHGMGEYIGLLNHEEGDLAPPSTLYTKLPCETLRVDKAKFHALMAIVQDELLEETKMFLTTQPSALFNLSLQDKNIILPLLIKESLRSDQTVLRQDESSDFIYIIMKGRCQAYRAIPVCAQMGQQAKHELFSLWTYDKGDIFGEETALYNRPCSMSICTRSSVSVLKLHKDVLGAPGRQHLYSLIKKAHKPCPADEALRARQLELTKWKDFKVENVHQVVQADKKKRIGSAPSVMSSKERHLDFMEGEYRSKISTSWKINKDIVPKPAAPRPKTAFNLTEPGTVDNTQAVTVADNSKKHRILLSKVVSSLFTTAAGNVSDKPTVDARELHKKFANREQIENKMKQGWIYAAETSNEDMLTNNDLLTNVNSEEMIFNAVKAAKKQAEKVRLLKEKQRNDKEIWRSSLEDDLILAKHSIAYHRNRSRLLQRRILRSTASRSCGINPPPLPKRVDSTSDRSITSSERSDSPTETSATDQSEILEHEQWEVLPIRRCATVEPLVIYRSTTEEEEDKEFEDDDNNVNHTTGSLSERRSNMNMGSLWKGAQVAGRLLRIYQVQKFTKNKNNSVQTNDVEIEQ